MSKRSIWILTALVLVLVQGCATYHSRYYYQNAPSPRCFAGLCITPRVFAYQNEPGNSLKWMAIDSFQVSFRVTDHSIQLTDEDLHKTPEERRADAAVFQRRVFSSFRIDSLVLWDRLNAMARLESDLPDTSKYIPQAANYLTVDFGHIRLAETVSSLRAVVHLTRFDADSTPLPDSALFDLLREEYHEKGVQLLRDNVRGYED